MSTPDQPSMQLNEAQQRINKILLSNSFLLISAAGEVVAQNIQIEAIWPLLESVKLSLLSQYVNFCLDQRLNTDNPGAPDKSSSGS